ncbi:MAG TPA: cytidine deaminase [Frankiaceae bacterium]|nr:cytidine deaminase [Frankiaceae bacterium]
MTTAAQAPGLDPEDAKLVTLARSARVRSVAGDGLAAEGAAVRDETGRTYVAATVVRGPLRLPALHLAVASALASGARSFEAAAVVTAEVEPAGVDVLAAVGAPVLVVAGPDGTVRSAQPEASVKPES